MNFKDTFQYSKTSFTIWLAGLLLCVSRKDMWHEDSLIRLLIIFFFLSIPLILVTFVSLFSKRHDLEGKVGNVIRDTPVLIQLSVWAFLILFASIFHFGEFVPLPVAPFTLFLLFTWVAAVVGLLSQKMVVGILLERIEEDSKKPLVLMNQYFNTIVFGFIYVTFTRMYSLPWYVRKPIGLLIMLAPLTGFILVPETFNF